MRPKFFIATLVFFETFSIPMLNNVQMNEIRLSLAAFLQSVSIPPPIYRALFNDLAKVIFRPPGN